MRYRYSTLAASIATVLLTACGGGGGGSNVRPDIEQPPPPQTCQDQSARNFGQTGACIPRYRGDRDNALTPTNVDRARAQGFTGEGVRIGLLDGAPEPSRPGFSTYEGSYTFHGNEFMDEALRTQPNTDHGHRIAQHIVGRAEGEFEGGVAPGAHLEWLQFCAQSEGDDVGSCGGRFVAAYDFLFNRGVTIVNHSFAAQARFWEASSADQDVIRGTGAVFAQAVERDMLLVFAGGNRNEASIGWDAGMPYYYPEYRQNFLAVVGVDINADGTPGATAGSQCVVAAEWCLAAPFLVPHANRFSNGTSASAAVVSGIAALVSEAFPWMGGRNLQTTLLTTATDLGAPGVDPVFGWGMVNADRAVRGPAAFLTAFEANVDRAGSWTFANNIGGSGGLTKLGIGTLRLAGANTYTGLTDVRGGNLILAGSVAGDVRNAATFTSEGGRIGGNYTAASGSTTQVVVGRGLQVSGTASLDGTLNLLAPTDPQYQVQNAERVLQAGAINGTFGAVTVGSDFFYNASLAYSSTDVIANLVRKSAEQKAIELGAQQGVVDGARRMDSLLDYVWAGQGDAALRSAAFAIASAQDEGSALSSLGSLAGEVHGTVRVQAIEQAQGDAAVLADRAFGLRRASQDQGAWAQVIGRNGTLKSDGYADADLQSGGVLAGADTVVGSGLRLGASLSSSRASGDLEGFAGDLDVRRTGIGVYALAQGDSAYATFTAGLDRMTVETDRQINLGAAGLADVSSERRDRVQHARIEAGFEAVQGVVPYAALGGLRHRQGGFVEQGAGGAGIAADADSHTLSYAEAGVRLDRSTDAGGSWGGIVAGRWTLSGRDAGYTATFAGTWTGGVSDTGPVFDANGQRLPSSALRVGLNYISPDYSGWRWFAEGVAEATGDGVRDSRLGLGIRYSF